MKICRSQESERQEEEKHLSFQIPRMGNKPRRFWLWGVWGWGGGGGFVFVGGGVDLGGLGVTAVPPVRERHPGVRLSGGAGR